jgi:hypothetical protein
MKNFSVLILFICSLACTDKPKSDTSSNLLVQTDTSVILKNKNINDSLFSVARVDSIGHRIFVVIDTITTLNFKKIKGIIKQVDKKYKLNDDWNISFVSNIKYADYKDELQDKKGISYNEFYQNYLGEYDKKTRTYHTYPVIATKTDKYIFD